MIETDILRIGPSHPCFVIAEVAQAHDGSLGMAHAYIDAAARAGVDAIKFQTHIAAEESSIHEPWRVHFSYQDETRYDYWKRMEFDGEQWLGLKQHADRSGLVFISSPFSLAAIHLLDHIGVPLWKVASGETNSLYLIDEMVKTGKPIILSSGMSYPSEIDERAAHFAETGTPWALLECTTAYPTEPEQIDLSQMVAYRDRFHCPIGLSDHSGSIYPALAAAALGADIIEAHLCFSKDQFGPDTIASLTVDEMKTVVEGVRYIERMRKGAGSKESRTARLEDLRKIFGKGIVTRKDINKGEPFSIDNLAIVKPAGGIGAEAWEKVLASVALRDIPANTFIEKEMLWEK